jgi:hypothetical protein
MSQYDAALMVWPLGMNSTQLSGPKKTAASTLQVDNICLDFMGSDSEWKGCHTIENDIYSQG